MPGLEYYANTDQSTVPIGQVNLGTAASQPARDPSVYYNARLDPKNYLEGPLSWDPATRLRQMLARPGIVVRNSAHPTIIQFNISLSFRSHLASAMASVHAVHWRLALIAYTRGQSLLSAARLKKSHFPHQRCRHDGFSPRSTRPCYCYLE
jgi:hypothetical protein